MRRLFIIFYGVLVTLLFSSCEQNHSRHSLRDAPVINSDFYDQALEKVNLAIDRYPDNAINYYKKALILNELNRNENALINLRKAIALDSLQPQFHLLAAKEYAKIRDERMAFYHARLAEQLGLKNAALFHLFSQLHKYNHDTAQALAYINRGLRYDPTDPELFNRRAELLIMSGDTTGGSKDLATSLGIKETSGAYQQLALLAESNGDLVKAYDYWENYSRLGPDDPYVAFKKAELVNKAGYPDSAAIIYSQIATKYVDFPAPALAMAEYLMQRRRYDSAVYYLSQVLQKYPGHTQATLEKARLEDKRGNYQEAVATYEQLLSADTAHSVAREELAYLKRKVAYLQQLQRQRTESAEMPEINKKATNLSDQN